MIETDNMLINGPPEDRGEMYRECIVSRETDRARGLHDMGLKKVSRVITMMMDGGECLHCKVPWDSVAVDNLFAKYTYYVPACRCYSQCWQCKHWLIEEKELGSLPERCPNCRVRL